MTESWHFKILGLEFLTFRLKINTNLAMFGKSQTSLASSGTSRPNLPFIGQRFLIKKLVKKIACLSVSEFAIFRDSQIRNFCEKQLS